MTENKRKNKMKTIGNGKLITKNEIVEIIQQDSVWFTSKSHCREFVDKVFDIVADSLKQDKDVKIIEIGTLSVKTSAAREFNNKYGKFSKGERNTIKIKPSPEMKRALNKQETDN